MSIPVETSRAVAAVLTSLMLVVALGISASTTIKQMIDYYRLQAWLMAALVALTAHEQASWELGTLTVLPVFLAVAIKPMLARATRAGVVGANQAAQPPGSGPRHRLVALWRGLNETVEQTGFEWLQPGSSQRGSLSAVVIDVLLAVTAFIVAYRLIGADTTIQIDPNSLAVALALLLLGIFTMSNKKDTIAQIIGLLVMDQGLFLAAVRVAVRDLVLFFVLSLFFYILITLTILLWLLPLLHRYTGGIQLDEHKRQLRG